MTEIVFGSPIPTFRMFDIAKAREFYIDWLGFETVFQHRFAEDLPLFWAVRRGTFLLYLSEHHGDASPGAVVSVPTTNLDALHVELNAKKYRYGRPGIVEQEWGSRDLTVHDPFHNRIIFTEPKSSSRDTS